MFHCSSAQLLGPLTAEQCWPTDCRALQLAGPQVGLWWASAGPSILGPLILIVAHKNCELLKSPAGPFLFPSTC